jgi:hypothetical protein
VNAGVELLDDSADEDDTLDDIVTVVPTTSSGPRRGVVASPLQPRTQTMSSSLKPMIMRTTSVSSIGSGGTHAEASNKPSPHSYNPIDATMLHVRVGPNYRKEGRKAASKPALMRMVGCDLYYSEEKIDLLGQQVVFPESTYSDRASPLSGNLPHYFVFNLQLQKPTGAAASMFGQASRAGYSLALYFEPTDDFLKQVEGLFTPQDLPGDLATVECSNAAKLAWKWFNTFSQDQSMRERLKIKAHVMNPETSELSSWILKYNGKPAMITKSNTMTRFQGRTVQGKPVDVVECDVDLRVWNLLFRQGVNSVFPILNKLSFALALVIEGETDDELPEQVLAGVQLNYIDTDLVTHW